MIPIFARRIAKDTVLRIYGGLFRSFIKGLPASWAYRLSEFLAFFFFLAIKTSILEVSRELGRFAGPACDERTTRRIAQKACEIYVKRQIEDLFAGKINAAFIGKHVSIHGLARIDQALSQGKGGILLVGHFGSFRMILPALAFHGYKINQLVGNPVLRHHRRVHDFLFHNLEREYSGLPVNFIRADLSLRPALRALKNNELLVVAFDGREGNDWVELPFLGRTGKLSAGPARMALMFGAPLVPAVIVRRPGDRHEILIDAIIETKEDGRREDAIKTLVSRYVRVFEKYIKKYPCHFAMTVKVHQERYQKGIIDVPMIL